jgi:hypothetical protein
MLANFGTDQIKNWNCVFTPQIDSMDTITLFFVPSTASSYALRVYLLKGFSNTEIVDYKTNMLQKFLNGIYLIFVFLKTILL